MKSLRLARYCGALDEQGSVVPAHNKQLRRTVVPNRWRAASASLHYALAARFTRQRAAAELRR